MPAPRDGADALFAASPAPLRLPLLRCARGELPPHVALMQIAMAARGAAEVDHVLTDMQRRLTRCDAAMAARMRRARDLWRGMPDAFATVTEILRAVDHAGASVTAEQAVARCAAAFDRAAAVSPEASVALYSLGNPDLLDAVTDEIVEQMEGWGLVGPERRLLDLGCGIGRFVRRLAPRARFVVGVDISQRMVEEARRRCGPIRNAAILRSAGCDLAAFADGSFDLVYAIDSFPYLVQFGDALAQRHVEEAARVLTSGGWLLILNYSYRGDAQADRDDVGRFAQESGFAVRRDGARDFSLWDGQTFLLQRA